MKFLSDLIEEALKEGRKVEIRLSEGGYPLICIEGLSEAYELPWEAFEEPITDLTKNPLKED